MTIQIRESLIFNGEEIKLDIDCWPTLPKKHPGIIIDKIGDLNFDGDWRLFDGTSALEVSDDGKSIIFTHAPKDKSQDDAIIMRTDCRRGYLGTWEIRDNRLYLASLRGLLRLVTKEPLFADWYSGVIRIPKGYAIKNENMEFNVVYKHELHLKIERGLVVESRDVDNDTVLEGVPDQWSSHLK